MIIDQSRESESSLYGEFVRLSNEFRSKPETIVTMPNGTEKTISAKIGFDIETATLLQLKSIIPKSKAQEDFLKLVIKSKEGKIPENLELFGQSGLNNKKKTKDFRYSLKNN